MNYKAPTIKCQIFFDNIFNFVTFLIIIREKVTILYSTHKIENNNIQILDKKLINCINIL